MASRWTEPDLEDALKKPSTPGGGRRVLGMRPLFAGVAAPLTAALMAAVGTLQQGPPTPLPRLRPIPPLAPPPTAPFAPGPPIIRRVVPVAPERIERIDPRMIHQVRPGIDEAMIHPGRRDIDSRMIVPAAPVLTAPVVPAGPTLKVPAGTIRPR